MSSIKRIKPTISGLPEWTPSQRIVETMWLRAIEQTFELNGFSSLDTRAFETYIVLDSKSEASREAYGVVRRGKDEEFKSEGLGLRYDLTVPLARYVSENYGILNFPLRRYQIGKVWRGERPQEGRYREFYQADVDIVGNETLADIYEIEIPLVMSQALLALRPLGLPAVTLRANSRKLMEGFYRSLDIPESRLGAVMRAVDKLDRTDAYSVFMDLLEGESGITVGQAQMCLMLADVRGVSSSSELRQRLSFVDSNPLADAGIDSLCTLLDSANARGLPVVADLSIARGLDYYTGIVFESTMEGYENAGSVCSGGRYDSLATNGRTTFPGVGISFGLTRALGLLFAKGLDASRATPTCVVVALPSEDKRMECEQIAATLRSRGIATEVSATAAKYGKQIRSADVRNIPYVWFPGEEGADEVKDIRSGVQSEADSSSWMPAVGDLLPSIILPQ